MAKSMLDKFRDDPESARLLKQEEFLLDVTEKICELMEKKNLFSNDLAGELGVRTSAVEYWLDTGEMSIRELFEIMQCLGYNLSVSLQRIEK